jgi:hypothetical protein
MRNQSTFLTIFLQFTLCFHSFRLFLSNNLYIFDMIISPAQIVGIISLCMAICWEQHVVIRH